MKRLGIALLVAGCALSASVASARGHHGWYGGPRVGVFLYGAPPYAYPPPPAYYYPPPPPPPVYYYPPPPPRPALWVGF